VRCTIRRIGARAPFSHRRRCADFTGEKPPQFEVQASLPKQGQKEI